jgi:two-component sensor histidine kinase
MHAFSLIAEQAPLAVLIADSQQKLIYHNRAAKELFGEISSETNYASLLASHAVDEEIIQSGGEKLITPSNGKLIIVRTAQGKEIFVSQTVQTDEQGNTIYYLSNVHQQVKYINRVLAQQKADNRLSRSTHIRLGNLDKALHEIALVSASVMEVSRVNIWLVNEDFNSLTSLINYDAQKENLLDNITLNRSQLPNYFALLVSEEIVITENAITDPKVDEIRSNYILPIGIRSLIDIPIRIEGKMAGLICFEDTSREREWNITEQNFAVSIAQLIAQTLETNRRQQAQQELEQALGEKKLLLTELNHRIKNNFEIINDMIGIQEQKAIDEFHKNLFSGIRSRLLSIGMLHRQLYSSDNAGSINFRDFLLDLVTHFRSSFVSSGIQISTQLDNCKLTINKAVLCGLVINELLTNSGRHAFHKQQTGTIRLKLSLLADQIHITVSDDGEYDYQSDTGLGKKLIAELGKRLHAEIETEMKNGTTIHIRFSSSTH